MNSKFPTGLSRNIIDTAIPILEELEKSGWTVGVIHWDQKWKRKLGFSAKSPSGTSMFFTCHEGELVKKLWELLNIDR